MKLPLGAKDVKSVIDAAVGTGEDMLAPVSASLYVDETAPADVVAHVRAAFAAASAQARISIKYLGKCTVEAEPDDDFAVIVAGLDEGVGAAAAKLRSEGVPVMVATTLPVLVDAIARSAGASVPAGDIVSCAVAGPATEAAESEAARGVFAVKAVAESEGCADAVSREIDAENEKEAFDAAIAAEPYFFDAPAAALLDQRMGEWVVEAVRPKRLAMARAFPFVRRPLALDAVNVTAVENAGIGLVPFLPGADFPLMTINQAKMMLQIAAAYGEPMDAGRAREVLGTVVGALACRSAARSLAGCVPGLGWAVRALVGYAGTQAIGRAAIECFECGGGAAGLAGAVGRAVEGIARAREPEARRDAADAARAWADRAGNAARAVAEVAGPIARRAARAGAESFALGAASLARAVSEATRR